MNRDTAMPRTLVMLVETQKLFTILALSSGITTLNKGEAARHLRESQRLARNESGWRLEQALTALGVERQKTATDATNDATREPLPKIGDKVVVLVFKEGSGTLEDTHYLFQITKAA